MHCYLLHDCDVRVLGMVWYINSLASAKPRRAVLSTLNDLSEAHRRCKSVDNLLMCHDGRCRNGF